MQGKGLIISPGCFRGPQAFHCRALAVKQPHLEAVGGIGAGLETRTLGSDASTCCPITRLFLAGPPPLFLQWLSPPP